MGLIYSSRELLFALPCPQYALEFFERSALCYNGGLIISLNYSYEIKDIIPIDASKTYS